MRLVHTIAELRALLAGLPQPRVLLPTMGCLHEGHLALVQQAAALAGTTVVSIFANRLQFQSTADFQHYPRALERDCELLAQQGCSIVFAPPENELFPEPQGFRILPDPALADVLEGAFLPGCFQGICTIVMKLLHIVQPSHVIFGQKDYQQLEILRRMVAQFAVPVGVIAAATCRAPDGLALSTRNRLLSPTARQAAGQLPAALAAAAVATQQGRRDWQAIEAQALATLASQGWQPDYLSIRERATLQLPPDSGILPPLVVLGAARLDGVRLLDHLEFEVDRLAPRA